MNLDELRSVQSKERQKDSLQNLRPSFYQEVGEYIADLEDERDRVADQVDDPFSSPEVSRLTDEIETAKDVVEAIYERRMGKLVKQASLAAAGMAADDEGLTAEEADLFDDLVERIGSNKSRVLDVLEGVDTDTEAAAGGDDESAAGAGTEAEAGVEPDAVGTSREAPEPTRADLSPPPDTDPTAADPMDDPATASGLASESAAETDDEPPIPPQEPAANGDPTAETDGETGPGPAPDAALGTDGEAADADDSSGVTPADVMGGEGPDLGEEPAPAEPSDAPSTPSTDDTRPDAEPSETGPAGDATTEADDVDRVTVRITRDVGTILGVDDREYSLSSDDIVTLPERNADPLLEQDAAEPLE